MSWAREIRDAPKRREKHSLESEYFFTKKWVKGHKVTLTTKVQQ